MNATPTETSASNLRYYTTTVWWNDIDGPREIHERNQLLKELGIKIQADFLLEYDPTTKSNCFVPSMYWVSEDTELFGELNPWWFLKIAYELYFSNENSYWYLDRLRKLSRFFKEKMRTEIEIPLMDWIIGSLDDLNCVQYDLDSTDPKEETDKFDRLWEEKEELKRHFVDNFMRVYKRLSDNWKETSWQQVYPKLNLNGCQSREPGTDKTED